MFQHLPVRVKWGKLRFIYVLYSSPFTKILFSRNFREDILNRIEVVMKVFDGEATLHSIVAFMSTRWISLPLHALNGCSSFLATGAGKRLYRNSMWKCCMIVSSHPPYVYPHNNNNHHPTPHNHPFSPIKKGFDTRESSTPLLGDLYWNYT